MAKTSPPESASSFAVASWSGSSRARRRAVRPSASTMDCLAPSSRMVAIIEVDAFSWTAICSGVEPKSSEVFNLSMVRKVLINLGDPAMAFWKGVLSWAFLACMETPHSNSRVDRSVLSMLALICRAVSPLKFLVFISAPLLKSCSMLGAFPARMASKKGVLPSASLTSISAPRLKSRSSISGIHQRMESCRGVFPFKAWQLMSNSLSRRISALRMAFQRTAVWRSELPKVSLA